MITGMNWFAALLLALATASSACSLVLDTSDLDDQTPGMDADADIPGSVIFTDGFEDGLSPPWTQLWYGDNNTVVLDTDIKYSGDTSAHCRIMAGSGLPAATYVEFAEARQTIDLHIRQMLYLDEGFDAPGTAALGALYGVDQFDTDQLVFQFWTDDQRRFGFQNLMTGQTFNTTYQLPLRTWFLLELLVSARPGGNVTVRNGADEILSEAQTFGGSLTLESYATCLPWQEEAIGQHALYLDDVVIAQRVTD
jgi:hypothetical protein